MAIAAQALTFTKASVTSPGTSVAPAVPVPDNCHTILIRNTDTGNDVYVGQGAPGGALDPAGSTPNALRITPLSSLTLSLGTQRYRGILDQSVLTGTGLIFDASGGTPTVEITYLNALGVAS